ncbi:hypothetical protein QZH41_016772 [Actinostola sp. cb2023]|nr:hypothetical protein QZH41_016772 [Actinostola sp. cb2023]
MDTENVEPLTPNHLLTMKTKILLPGVFMKADLYCRKRWRRVQHLTNEFWKKWRKEYLQTLQMRKKWTAPTRNVKVDDVVIIKDDNLPMNDWKLARVHKIRLARKERFCPEPGSGVAKVFIKAIWCSVTFERHFKRGARFQEGYDWIGSNTDLPLRFGLQRPLIQSPIHRDEAIDSNSQPLVSAQLIASVVDALKAPLASMVEQAVYSARMSPGQGITRAKRLRRCHNRCRPALARLEAFPRDPLQTRSRVKTPHQDLLSENIATDEPEPELLFDGRLVLTNITKKNKCKIRDIITWMEAFTIYMMIICSYFPHRWSDLTKYKLLIVRTFRLFGGQGWLNYDREFRETVAAERLTDWSNMNVQLYNFNTACAPVRPRLLSS